MKFIAQHDQMDCGPASLCMIADHYGKYFSIEKVRELCFLSKEGVSLLGIKYGADRLGFESFGAKVSIDDLSKDMFPLILHWEQNHFVILYDVKNNFFTKEKEFYIADPGKGKIKIKESDLEKAWITDAETRSGVVLLLEPTEEFYSIESDAKSHSFYRSIKRYVSSHTSNFAFLFTLLFLGSISTLAFPFLTEKLIDKGINSKSLSIVTYILMGQLFVFLGSVTIEMIRNRITLVMGTKINISIISTYLDKLLRLPINFFDIRMKGDFSQRMQDHVKIEQFLTSQSLTTVFSLLTFMVFFGVLGYYDMGIMVFYLSMTVISVLWSVYWVKKRESFEYRRFKYKSLNQEAIYEIVEGISEIKINQYEEHQRENWKEIQNKIYEVSSELLKIDQIQSSGFAFLNQVKNILVTFMAASLVIKGEMTLGMLLSISFIIGQLNSPIDQLIVFFKSLQAAKLSLERLEDVNYYEEEEKGEQEKLQVYPQNDPHINLGIRLTDVSFVYSDPFSKPILKDINLFIPHGKTTAIVGTSGSGKTTLMKLLLQFYGTYQGEIFYNNQDMKNVSPTDLRKNIGVVMQDGYIFSGSILKNIVMADENVDYERLKEALDIAHLNDYVDNLPLGVNTIVGEAGNGMSGGQKQRILIARSVYKNPSYVFFDEATSALDAENESIIQRKLYSFLEDKTAIIIAHRLSTVMNADQIIVLDKGEVKEVGNHELLLQNRSTYFNLVRNQLQIA
ncbi:peptidase domain-containing ABC transporter [Chryseobacterium sp. SIMBA_028]|uniref:peptidase domain-containing ABC transporter n=1 Tax=Chryseobacterium sp. SIMBA_028 TaxID=3085771 RepID=UPI00397864B3